MVLGASLKTLGAYSSFNLFSVPFQYIMFVFTSFQNVKDFQKRKAWAGLSDSRLMPLLLRGKAFGISVLSLSCHREFEGKISKTKMKAKVVRGSECIKHKTLTRQPYHTFSRNISLVHDLGPPTMG